MSKEQTDNERRLSWVASRSGFDSNKFARIERNINLRIIGLRGVPGKEAKESLLTAKKDLLLSYIKRLQYFVLCIPKEDKDRAMATIAGHYAEIGRIDADLTILREGT